MKNFNKEEYTQNILHHQKYITTLYEQDTNLIAENIKNIIQESANPSAPVTRIQPQ